MTVQRLTKTPWYHYFLWHLGRDEWSFVLDGLELRIVNQWIGFTRLLLGNQVLAQTKGLFEISGTRPILQAKVRTSGTTERSVAIYVKAITRVNIRVEVDGKQISNGFV